MAKHLFFRLTVVVAIFVCVVAAALQRLGAYPLQLHNPRSPAYLRMKLASRPSDARLHAQLALSLLQPLEAVAPNTDADSHYGDSFTLYHPNVAESRRHLDMALKARGGSTIELERAHMAVLMAEGRGEDAIQPGRRATELAPKSAATRIEFARAHLLAACAQGCAAREDLRREKREEKATGPRSELEKREEEAAKSEARKGAKPGVRGQDRSSLRAGAMWRLMEAGRLFQQAATDETSNEEARRLARASKKLVTLDAFKVLNTEQVITFGQCHFFFGQELDGNMCDKKRHKYE